MKSKLLIVLLVSLSLFLSGCNFDETFESTQQHDGDDMNVIRDIWPQALDQVFQWKKSTSITQWLDQAVQTSAIQTIPVTSSVNVQTAPVPSQNTSSSEDTSEWEND